MERFAHARQIASLDAQQDCSEIYRLLVTHEFPWDVNQALSFALFRTYAVPSIGALLHRTGEFTTRTQKRYEDTVLLLDAVLEHGPGSRQGRDALRRVNQMHGAYDISQDDLRYVLCTFVVVPIRWLDEFGWRRLTEHEKTASAHHYREVGRLMGITEIPDTWQEFARVMDAYETRHFAHDPGGVAVAEATLALLAEMPPYDRLPGALVRQGSLALMDEPLRCAFGFRAPLPGVRTAVRTGLRARAQVVRRMPVRTTPLHGRQLPTMRLYPDGYDVQTLGTFPRGCPGGGADAAS